MVPSTRANFRMIEGRGESLPGPPRASTSATSGSVALPLMSRRLLFPRDPDDSSLPSALGAFPWGGEAIRRRREVDSVRGFGGPWYNALRDALLPPLLLLFAVAVEVELGALSVPVLPMTALQQKASVREEGGQSDKARSHEQPIIGPHYEYCCFTDPFANDAQRTYD